MRIADLDYELPKELIAQRPPEERDGGRLLVVPSEPNGQALIDSEVLALPNHLPKEALLVVNDTRVVAARLLGRKVGSGGHIELFLTKPIGESDGATRRDTAPPRSSGRFLALSKSSKKVRAGMEIAIGESGRLRGVIARDRTLDQREIEVILSTSDGSSVDEAIESEGHIPLPPYVDRADDVSDRERYQTVFARASGAVAAPTAGFHFSERLVSELRARGNEIVAVTLHVGLGTFAPVTVDDLDDHSMHEETFSVSAEAAHAIGKARDRGAPVVAIGTTVVRALESARDPERPGHVIACDNTTKILIQPGYDISTVDMLLTNFHLPRSTLLALVSAFAGRERIRAAYEHAVRNRYRFFSYGDAMLLSRAHALSAKGVS